MNGAQLLVKTAVKAGIEVCFTNPGTTELPIVSALDAVGGIRAVLGLSEGCCSGAADGYGRMLDKPAMVLLHLGPGLANGIANLHNARRAGTPVLAVIGEHATWHRPADAPLTMDIEALAGTVSGWQRTACSAAKLAEDTAAAVGAARKGLVASLIVPHDCQWESGNAENRVAPGCSERQIAGATLEEAVEYLRGSHKTVLILGGRALRKRGLQAAERIRAACGCDLLAETFPAHMERGTGIPAIERIPYFPRRAVARLSRYKAVVLAGAREPVAFFGYPGLPSRLLTEDQKIYHLDADPYRLPEALENLADLFGAARMTAVASGRTAKSSRCEIPQGRLTAPKR